MSVLALFHGECQVDRLERKQSKGGGLITISRWDPFTVLARLDSEFDDLVRRTWGPQQGRTAGFVPAVEVARDGTDVVISLELPGVDVERDVNIEVAQGRLTISGERQEMVRSGQDTGVLVRELRYGAFRRDFALPEHVSADDVEAAYDRGMLFVRVHNVARPVEQPRKVAIQAGGSPKAVGASSEQTESTGATESTS